MPCYTYIPESETDKPIQNKVVAEWLESARKATGIRMVIRELRFDYRIWFRTKTHWRYEVLWPSGGCEYQIVNFYREDTETSINLLGTAELTVAYLIGICSGVSAKENYK